MAKFKSMPQRRPKSTNSNWATMRRKATEAQKERNREKIAKMEEAVRLGDLKPLVLDRHGNPVETEDE